MSPLYTLLHLPHLLFWLEHDVMFLFQDDLGLPFALFPGNVPWMISFSKQSPSLRMTRKKYLNFLVLTVAYQALLSTRCF